LSLRATSKLPALSIAKWKERYPTFIPSPVAVEPNGTAEVGDGEKNVMHPGNGSG
jgi:hypothetical protein